MADPEVDFNIHKAAGWEVGEIGGWLEKVTRDEKLKPLWEAFIGPFLRAEPDPTARKSLRVVNQGTSGELILNLNPLEFTLHDVTWTLHTFWDALTTVLNCSLRYEGRVGRKPEDYAVCILTLTLKWSKTLKECLNAPKNIPPIFSIFWVEVKGSWIFLLCAGKAVEYEPNSQELRRLTDLLVRERRDILLRDLMFNENDNPFSPQVLEKHKAPVDLDTLDKRITEYSIRNNQEIPDTKSTIERFRKKLPSEGNVKATNYEIGSCAETWGFQLMKRYPSCDFFTFSLSNEKHKKIDIGPNYTYRRSGAGGTAAAGRLQTKKMCTNCSYVASAFEVKLRVTLTEFQNIPLPETFHPPPIPTAQEVGAEDQGAPQPPPRRPAAERDTGEPHVNSSTSRRRPATQDPDGPPPARRARA